MPGPICANAPVPEMTPPKVNVSVRLMAKVPLSTTLPTMRARGAAVAELQRAGADRRAAGIGVGAGEDRGSGPDLGERAGAADHAGKGHRVAAVEDRARVVDDVADDAAGGAAIADLQRPGADRRGAGIGVGAGEDRGAGAGSG